MNIQQPTEIVLVEDDLSDAELSIYALKKNKLINNIVHLKDGEEALDFMFSTGKYAGREIKPLPALVLLDLKMPGMTGIEVLRRLKGNELTRQVPVVVLTSSVENPDIAECYVLGANSYIVKPVEFENFSAAVTEIGLYWLLFNQRQ